MTLGQRIDALHPEHSAVFKRVLEDVLKSETQIRDWLHGDPRKPGAMLRADILEKLLR